MRPTNDFYFFISGDNCYKTEENPIGMIDRFDNRNEPNELWRRTVGSMLGTMCGTVDTENALFFPGDGTREAVTVPIDTRHLRWVCIQYSAKKLILCHTRLMAKGLGKYTAKY